MTELNVRIESVINHLEEQCQELMSRLDAAQKCESYSQEQFNELQIQKQNDQEEISQLKHQQKIQAQSLEDSQRQLEIYKEAQLVKSLEQQQVHQGDDSQKITNLEAQNQALEEKYQSAYQMLQKEMVKVDTMQMELELAQRERDIALRKQSLTPDQKKMLIKLEHENYKINEAIERIEYISEALRHIIAPETEEVPEKA